jgi:hypothetical protein
MAVVVHVEHVLEMPLVSMEPVSTQPWVAVETAFVVAVKLFAVATLTVLDVVLTANVKRTLEKLRPIVSPIVFLHY